MMEAAQTLVGLFRVRRKIMCHSASCSLLVDKQLSVRVQHMHLGLWHARWSIFYFAVSVPPLLVEIARRYITDKLYCPSKYLTRTPCRCAASATARAVAAAAARRRCYRRQLTAAQLRVVLGQVRVSGASSARAAGGGCRWRHCKPWPPPRPLTASQAAPPLWSAAPRHRAVAASAVIAAYMRRQPHSHTQRLHCQALLFHR